MPIMVFQSPGPHKIHGVQVEYRVIPDDDLPDFQDKGWSLTAIEAGEVRAKKDKEAADAAEAAKEAEIEQELSVGPPTRSELEQMATKLALKFDGRTSDRKLRLMIDAAVSKD